MELIQFPSHFLFGLVILLVILLVAVVVLKSLLPERPRWAYRYARKEYLLTQSERDCFNALLRTVGDRYHVFPQIHLASILEHKIRGQNWRGAFRHIDEKSVDFVLCDKDTMSIALAIELDDWSHARPDRQERDKEVERILSGAGVPLLRFGHDFIEIETELVKIIQTAMEQKGRA